MKVDIPASKSYINGAKLGNKLLIAKVSPSTVRRMNNIIHASATNQVV